MRTWKKPHTAEHNTPNNTLTQCENKGSPTLIELRAHYKVYQLCNSRIYRHCSSVQHTVKYPFQPQYDSFPCQYEIHSSYGGQDGSVTTVTMLWAVQSGFQFPPKAHFSKMSRLAPRPKQPPSEWVQGFLFLVIKQQILSTHLYIVVRQRLSGAVPPFPLHNFMPYTGTTVPLSLHKLKLQRRNNYVIWNLSLKITSSGFCAVHHRKEAPYTHTHTRGVPTRVQDLIL